MNVLLIAICVLVLTIGLEWTVTAIHSGSVSRIDSPMLFWCVMAMAALGVVEGIALQITGR